MRICYSSHDNYALKKPSHRTSRDYPERGFYTLLSYNKNGHVVIREAPLVQQLNHTFIAPVPRPPPGPETLSRLSVNHSTDTYTLPGFVQIRSRA